MRAVLCCCTARRLLTLRINPCCIDAVWDTQHPARSALDFNVPESRLRLPAWNVLPWQHIKVLGRVIQHHRAAAKRSGKICVPLGGNHSPLAAANTRGQPKAGVIQQLITVLWFCTATLLKAQQRLQVHPNTFILSMADTDGGSAI